MNFQLVKPLDPEDESLNLEGETKLAHEELIGDSELIARFAELRKMVDTEQCLIHADNHQGSIFFDDNRCVVKPLFFTCNVGGKI